MPYRRTAAGVLEDVSFPADWTCPIRGCGCSVGFVREIYQHGTGQVAWLVRCTGKGHEFCCVQTSDDFIRPSRYNRTVIR